METNYIVGQDSLISKIDAYSESTFPQSIIVEGLDGSGRHTIVSYITNKFGYTPIELNDVTADIVQEIQLSTNNAIYIFDDSNLTIRHQNILLKLIEEPQDYVHIAIITNDIKSLLPTVRNRCQIFKLSPYDKATLKSFLKEELPEHYLDFLKTPGDVLSISRSQIEEASKLSQLIIDKIDTAAFGNIFNILNHIDVDGKQSTAESIPLKLFMCTLLKLLLNKAVGSTDAKYYKAYTLVNEYAVKCQQTKSNITRLVEKLLFELKMCLKYGN